MPPTLAPLGTTIVSIYFIYAYKKYILIKVYRPNFQSQPQLGDAKLVIENIYARHMLTVDKVHAIAAAVSKRGK